MADADGGVFIYHPLYNQTSLFALYENAQQAATEFEHALSKEDETRLVHRYRIHMGDVLARRGAGAASLPEGDLKQDGRELIHRFRKFFPAFLEKTTLTEHAAKVAVFFPAIGCFDNRC